MSKRYFETPGVFLPPGDRSKDKFNELYTVNSSGYRTIEFDDIDWNNSVVIFGCSNVFGTGLTDEETLASRLENLLGRPVINMGQPGTAMFYSFYNQMVLKEMQAMPRAIINLWTSTERMTYFEHDRVLPVGAWSTYLQNEVAGKLYQGWTANEHNSDGYSKTLQRTVRVFWKDTVHLEATWFPHTNKVLEIPLLKRIDAARDGGHPGKMSTYEAAKVFHDLLRNKL